MRWRPHFAGARDRLLGSLLAAEKGPGEDLTGERVNCWRLAARIARGGAATVYRAVRDDGEFEQTVAVKVLRRGLDTDDLIARFRAERQILSSLDHPAIVPILDGGALPDGRPFLVLDFIEGLPITEHCGRHGLDVHARIRLVIEVLDALHHAHSRLVVHRDVKPSNILVSNNRPRAAARLRDRQAARRWVSSRLRR
jgi:eukaryotic-like serine/threonine-protein kinase